MIVKPLAIALCLVVLAVLNLRGNEIGRIGSWILQPILLVAGGLVTYRQAYTTRFPESAFKKDPTLARIDLKAFVDAAMGACLAWFLPVVRARFVLVTIGSVVIHILLTGPAASAHFDRERRSRLGSLEVGNRLLWNGSRQSQSGVVGTVTPS